MTADNDIIPMPIEFIGLYHNGHTTEPCDMIQGPCACGAGHDINEWDEAIVAYVVCKEPWAAKYVSKKKQREHRKVFGARKLRSID